MKKFLSFLILSIIFSTYLLADVFMTELTDPQNSSDAGRYVELYNNGDSDVDFSTGWTVQRWTNGNADPTASSMISLSGTISAGGFYIICNDAGKYNTTYGLTCDQDIGTGGFADSNGDDNMAILDASGAIADMFGVAGEDGTGTGHEFEDGRAERADTNTSASATWDETGWNIDNDSGGGDGNQYAPEGFDPGAWIGAGPASDTCDDESACNTGTDGACEYPDTGYDCDGNCIGEVDCAGNCGGTAVEDCFGECDGGAVDDDCGECGGDNSTCSVSVSFSVDMSTEGVIGDIKLRTSTENGDYLPSDWYIMTDDGDGIYSYTLSLITGIEYGYNFNNSDGSGYESGDGLAGCAGGNYGNDRFVTPGDSDSVLDIVCWESCEACPEVIPGCTEEAALNYDENATEDDGSCFYEWPETSNLFFSEVAEGSSNNKYLEIYNASGGDVDLSGYSLSSCSNGCNDGVSWDYPDNVSFDAGTTVAAGDVYVVCHGSADDLIQVECDQTFTYLSNGDDVFALTQVGSGAVLDIIGTIGDDPGSGWDVAGVSDGTKDHTIVRKASVTLGNGGDWTLSAGTDADDSEWVVLDQNTWDYVGSHPHEFSAPDPCVTISELSVAGDELTVTMTNSGFADGDHYHAYVDGVSAGMHSSDSFTLTIDCDAGDHAVTITAADGSHSEYTDECSTHTAGFTSLYDLGCGCGEPAAETNYDCDGNCTADVDCFGECGGSAVEDDCGECNGDGSSCACDSGDVNDDGSVNVNDIVIIVADILNAADYDACADANGDGLMNVNDIVIIVNIILGGSRTAEATEATLNIANGSVSVKANGFVGAVQMTLSHGSDFTIELTDKAMIADYKTNGNSTTLIVVAPESEELFEASGDFTVEEIIVANENSQATIAMPTELTLSKAYPNPFNPSTTFDVYVPVEGAVSLSVYNVMGQLVDVIHSGGMAEGSHSITWNASNMTSGMYFVRAESASGISVQKVMLMK
jgi:hypothetical protein